MNPGCIIIISGPPGAGKTTVSRLLTDNSPREHTVCVHTDDFYNNIRKGYIAPWKSAEAQNQNIMVSKIMASCAARYAEAGYEVTADGFIGGAGLDHWFEAVKSGIDLYYVILLPDLKTTLQRNEIRDKNFNAHEGIARMVRMVYEWEVCKSHFIDTTNHTPNETAAVIRGLVNDGGLLLSNKNQLNLI
jgi:chloramphenicol 3-O-phosphotransferase